MIIAKIKITELSYKHVMYIMACVMMISGVVGFVVNAMHHTLLPAITGLVAAFFGSILSTKIENSERKNVGVMNLVPASFPDGFWMKDQK